MAEELFSKYGRNLTSILLIPSEGGLFEVEIDGDLVFSKKALKRHANAGEIAAIVGRYADPRAEPEHDSHA